VFRKDLDTWLLNAGLPDSWTPLVTRPRRTVEPGRKVSRFAGRAFASAHRCRGGKVQRRSVPRSGSQDVGES
jgi:hypothetical protein